MEELKPSLLKSLHERSCLRKDPRSETPPSILFKKSLSNVGMPDSSTILRLISGGVHADSGLWLKAMKTDGKANTDLYPWIPAAPYAPSRTRGQNCQRGSDWPCFVPWKKKEELNNSVKRPSCLVFETFNYFFEIIIDRVHSKHRKLLKYVSVSLQNVSYVRNTKISYSSAVFCSLRPKKFQTLCRWLVR